MVCEAAGQTTPATHLHVDAVARIMGGFGWTEDAAVSAGYLRDQAMCDECYRQLPGYEAR